MFEIIKALCEEISKQEFSNTVAYIEKGEDYKFKHKISTEPSSLIDSITNLAASVNAKRIENIKPDDIIYFHSFSVIVNINKDTTEIVVEDNFRTETDNTNKVIVE